MEQTNTRNNNREKFRDAIDGKEVPYEKNFYRDGDFKERFNYQSNLKLLHASQVIRQRTAKRVSNALRYQEAEQQARPSKDREEAENFWKFMKGPAMLSKEIQRRLETFRSEQHAEKEVLQYIEELLDDIRDHNADHTFPSFDKLDSTLKDITTFANYSNELDRIHETIDLKTGHNKRVNIFSSPQHLEDYKGVRLAYNSLNAGLGTYIYDRGQEPQLDAFIRTYHLNDQLTKHLGRGQKKELVEQFFFNPDNEAKLEEIIDYYNLHNQAAHQLSREAKKDILNERDGLQDPDNELILDEILGGYGLDSQRIKDLNRDLKKELFERFLNTHLDKFVTSYMDRYGTRTITEEKVNKIIEQNTSNFSKTKVHQLLDNQIADQVSTLSISITPSVRMKTEPSKMRKSMTKNDYISNIKDYVGCMNIIQLPELSSYLNQKQKQLDELLAHDPIDRAQRDAIEDEIEATKLLIRAIKWEVVDDLAGYLASLLGTYSFDPERVRTYLSPQLHRQESSSNHQALNITANELKAGKKFTFPWPIEIQFVLEYGDHKTLRNAQYKKLAGILQQTHTGEELLRKLHKHIMTPINHIDYLHKTPFHPEPLDPWFLDDPDYLARQGKRFRKINAERFLVDTYIDCDYTYFEKLFDIVAPDDPDKKEKLKEKMYEKIFNVRPEKLDAEKQARGKYDQYIKEMLKIEKEFIIGPLKAKLTKQLETFAEGEVPYSRHQEIKKRLDRLKKYQQQINQVFKIH